MKLDHQLTPYTRTNSKWIKDLNISCDTIKVLAENIGSKISDIPHCNIFAGVSPRARETKEKINKWDYHQIKKLLHGQSNHHQSEKGTYSMGEHLPMIYWTRV